MKVRRIVNFFFFLEAREIRIAEPYYDYFFFFCNLGVALNIFCA